MRYGDHPDHVADVWLPAAPPPGPIVLFLHGGFWRAEYDRSHVGPLAEALAGEGFIVALAEFRRTGAPGGGWPGTFDDVAAAIGVVPGLVAERAGIPATGALLAGHSAGGHLALWGAAHAPAGQVCGVVALAPVADLHAGYALDLDGGAVAALMGGAPDEVADRYAAADPMRLVPLRVPVTVVHGARDRQVPVDFSRGFASAAVAAGDDVSLHELPDVDHFAVIDPKSLAWAVVVSAVRGTWQRCARV